MTVEVSVDNERVVISAATGAAEIIQPAGNVVVSTTQSTEVTVLGPSSPVVISAPPAQTVTIIPQGDPVQVGGSVSGGEINVLANAGVGSSLVGVPAKIGSILQLKGLLDSPSVLWTIVSNDVRPDVIGFAETGGPTDLTIAGITDGFLLSRSGTTIIGVDPTTIGVTDHTLLTNIGVNTHPQIDTHLADSTIHFTEASISHLNIGDIGSNSHAVIDTHLADTSNPHSVSLFQAYDVSNGLLTVDVANSTLIVRDNATPVAPIFQVEDNGLSTVFSVTADEMSIGPTGRRLMRPQWPDTTGRFGVELWPDDFSITTATGTQNVVFFSDPTRTITMAIPGGGGVGDDTAPGFVNLSHTARFEDQGNIFASQLLVNAAVQVECAANVGPIYLFLDQYRTLADGGVFTCSQHNAMRAQPRWGPNINAGDLTQTSVELYFGALTVDGTVGSASITTASIFSVKGATLISGGAIGTFNGIDIVDITGPTTIRGINSAMTNGTFINHTGTAPSAFSGDIRMLDDVSTIYGTTAGVEIVSGGGSVLEIRGVGATFNEGLQFQMEGDNNIRIGSGTGASLNINTIEFAFGPGLTADGTNNWVMAFAPGLRSTQLDADYAEVLFTSSTAITIAHAIPNFATWTVNAPLLVLGGGSIVSAANVIIQTNMNQGTNRYGLLVTSSPTGGTLNYTARFTGDAGVRIDGIFEHTGITLGLYGSTPVVQSAAYTPTNVTPDRVYDANSTTLNEIADVLGTLIADLQATGIIG